MDFDFSFFLVIGNRCDRRYLGMLCASAEPQERETKSRTNTRRICAVFFPDHFDCFDSKIFIVEPFPYSICLNDADITDRGFYFSSEIRLWYSIAVLNTKIVEVSKPVRGDIVVFVSRKILI